MVRFLHGTWSDQVIGERERGIYSYIPIFHMQFGSNISRIINLFAKQLTEFNQQNMSLVRVFEGIDKC